MTAVDSHLTQDEVSKEPQVKKYKRVRLLLDSRTELTNDELQVRDTKTLSSHLSSDPLRPQRARNLYLEEQAQIRRELDAKKAEKNGEMLLEEMILGVPHGGK